MSQQTVLAQYIRQISDNKVSGTIYMHSTHKYPCHIIDFNCGKTIVIELFYHYYDHVTFAFRKTTMKDIVRQRGCDTILKYMMEAFPEMFYQS